jgi:hypothetical protein
MVFGLPATFSTSRPIQLQFKKTSGLADDTADQKRFSKAFRLAQLR